MPPTAIITQPIAAIPFASLPANVGLSGASSTPGTGSITTWEWTLRTYPTGSTASLSGATTSTPTLNNVVIPGTYVIDLNVMNDSAEWAWDHVDADAWLTVPVVMPTARVYVVATTEFAALSIPGVAERQTTASGAVNNLQAKWEGVFNEVDDLRGDIDSFIAGASFEDIYVNNIHELTPAHTIVLKDDVTSEGSIFIANGETLSTRSISGPLAADLLVTASDDIDIVAGDVLGIGAGGAVTVTAGAGQSVTVAGGVGFPDLKTDVIGEATAAAGVTVDSVLLKDGEVRTTHVYTEPVTSLIVEGFDELTLGGTNGVSIITSGFVVVDATTTITVTADGLVSVDAGEGAITLDAQDSIDITTSTGGAGTNDITITAAGDTIVQHAVFSGASAAASALAISSILADDVPGISVTLDGAGDEIAINAATTVVSGTLEVNTINERGGGSGVTIEDIRLENEGSNVYAFDVGNAASTLNIMANTDTTPPGALTANVYGELNLVSTITANVYDGIVGWIVQADETITGAVGTTETAFTASTITIPADWILVGSDLFIEAWFDCTGVGAATNYIAKVYWGSLATGVAINAATSIGVNTANDVRVRACINYTAIGGSPGWNSWGDLTSNANNAYIQSYTRFAQATQPTNATISLQAAIQFSGGVPNGSDIITLRKLRIRQGFNEVV